MLKRVQQYFNSPAISQSQLKAILNGVGAFKTIKKEGDLYYEEKESLIIGSAVDCILTERDEKNQINLKTFYEDYYISIIKKPSDTIMSIIQEIYNKVDKDSIENLNDLKYSMIILEVCNNHNYQNNWKDDTRVKKIIDEGSLYWEELIKSKNKQILDKEQSLTIWNIVISLLTHNHTKKYFECNNNSIKLFFQTPIYFTYENEECKSLLDLIIIDYDKKLIIPCDIKTIGDFTSNFLFSVKKFRYDIQAAFYLLALESFKIKYNLNDFKIMNFKFIVESTIQQGCPLIYTIKNSDIYYALLGDEAVNFCERGQCRKLSNEIKGIKQAIYLYKWYKNNHPEMKYNKEIVEGDGELLLNIWS